MRQLDKTPLNTKEYIMDKDKLAAQLGFKRSDVDMLIAIFRKNAEVSISEMYTMIKQNNIQGIADAAHAIKGSAGNLKLDEIFELSKSIEIMAKTTQDADYAMYHDQLQEMIDRLNE